MSLEYCPAGEYCLAGGGCCKNGNTPAQCGAVASDVGALSPTATGVTSALVSTTKSANFATGTPVGGTTSVRSSVSANTVLTSATTRTTPVTTAATTTGPAQSNDGIRIESFGMLGALAILVGVFF